MIKLGFTLSSEEFGRGILFDLRFAQKRRGSDMQSSRITFIPGLTSGP